MHEEKKLDPSIIARAIHQREDCRITDIKHDLSRHSILCTVDIVTRLAKNDIIIDVRHPDECEQQPCEYKHHHILTIPFYRLEKQFSNLASDYRYVLFCNRGVISRLYAAYLHNQGYVNVAVFSPETH